MKVVEYTSPNYPGTIFTKEFDLEDIIENIDEFDKATVKEICIEFLEMLMDDLIEENNYFLFPLHKFGYMFIGKEGNINHENYRYDPVKGIDNFSETEHSLFQPMILGKEIAKLANMNKWTYRARFLGKTQKKFQSVIDNGHYY